MLKLYDYFRSSASFRVRIALNLKKLDYEAIPIHLLQDGGQQFTEQYQKINPHSLVPALQVNQQILTQSLAIIEYLDEIHPTPVLLPTDPLKKAIVRSFALSIAADMHPLNNLRVLNYLTNTLGVSDEQKNQWYKHWVEKGLAGLEKQLQIQNQAYPFCFGDEPGLADICLVPQLFNARRFSCTLTHYPMLVKIDSHCQQHPAFTKAWPVEVTA